MNLAWIDLAAMEQKKDRKTEAQYARGERKSEVKPDARATIQYR
jgi:hypothetical protein